MLQECNETAQITHCIICGKELTPRQIKRGNGVCSKHCSMIKRYQNPDARQKQSDAQKLACQRPEVHENKSNARRNYLSDPKNYNKHIANMQVYLQTKEVRNARTFAIQQHYNNMTEKDFQLRQQQIKQGQEQHNAKQKISKASIEHWQNPKYREAIISSSIEYWSNPENRQAQSIRMSKITNTLEYKQKQSNAQKIAQNVPETTHKRSESLIKYYQNIENRQKLSITQKTNYKTNEDTILQKRFVTMKQNGSFNTSKPEQTIKQLLEQKFNKVECQYRCNRYLFNCDFYIPSLDLFIELNFHWTHGHKSFDELDQSCLDQLNKWKEKAKTSKFYQNAIYTWTDLDVRKLKIFNEHKLNYKIFYTHKEFKEWFNSLK